MVPFIKVGKTDRQLSEKKNGTSMIHCFHINSEVR